MRLALIPALVLGCAASLIPALGWAGCALVPDRPEPSLDFGDPYQILINGGRLEIPAEEFTPRLTDEDALVVDVQYRGGCGEHAFTVEQRAVGEAVEVWLRHTAAPASCPVENVRETVTRGLSAEATAARAVVLLGPDGEERVLRGRR